MSLLSPAMQRLDAGDRASPEFLRCLELAGVENSLDNLLTYPWIRGRVQRGELHLHGAYFGRAGGSWCAIRQMANSIPRSAKGNRNALKHARYTAEAIPHRRRISGQLRRRKRS